MINQKAKYLLQKINNSLSEVKMRYRVTFEIDEEVEVNANATSEEIVEKAIRQVVGMKMI